MENPVSAQLVLFGQAILLGTFLALLYDLIRPFRLYLSRLAGLLDGSYCLTVTLAVFLFALRRSDGQLRGFILLGAFGGAVLYFCVFSALLRPIWSFWAETIFVCVQILTLPLVWAKNFYKKLIFRGKNLFYFVLKCYTMSISFWKSPRHKGERTHGKKGK